MMFFILSLIWFLPFAARAQEELNTNVITSKETKYTWVSVRLPHAPDSYILDSENYYFVNDFCYSKNDWNKFMQCKLEPNGTEYIAKLLVHEPAKHIRLSWSMPEFKNQAKMSYITQFFMPNNEWKQRDKYCLQPQYSTPLIRPDIKEDFVEIKCAIYLPSCYFSRNVSSVMFVNFKPKVLNPTTFDPYLPKIDKLRIRTIFSINNFNFYHDFA
ncbi:unnamed protein product [Dibothriocephalus latus]|uniref:Uncharacterized protein n=1 Tax=Dibothriocephalus latus TaxID=60516 RepID=A0A3P7LCJ0_DIBLA|nr:unnamed protein product [Dibothriocephalus latus]